MEHEHTITEQTVNLLWYVIQGDGHWMTRWHCTDGDVTLCIVSVLAATWAFVEYIRYAMASHRALKYVPASYHYRRHLMNLRNVFIECGAIHVMMLVVSWFWTPYWLVTAIMIHNAWQSHCLNASKMQVLALDEIALIRKQNHDLRDQAQAAVLHRDEMVLENSTLRQKLAQHITDLESKCPPPATGA